MSDSLVLGPAPGGEVSTQLGAPGYEEAALRECRAHVQALRRKLGPEPDGAALVVEGFAHDFGTYYTVVCHFDEALPLSVEYALCCEADGPQTWDEVGMKAPTKPRRDSRGR